MTGATGQYTDQANCASVAVLDTDHRWGNPPDPTLDLILGRISDFRRMHLRSLNQHHLGQQETALQGSTPTISIQRQEGSSLQHYCQGRTIPVPASKRSSCALRLKWLAAEAPA